MKAPLPVAIACFLVGLVAGCSSGASETADTDPSAASAGTATAPTTTSTTASTTVLATSSTAADTTTTAPPDTAPTERPLPASSEELAIELSKIEWAIAQPGLDQTTAEPLGRRQQLLYRLLDANPSWTDSVIATVDPAVAEVVSHNATARRELSALVASESLSASLPAWRIEPPLPADELLGYYKDAGAATGIPWEVLAAINLVETRMGRIHGVSTAGAVGPMQFLPTTWAECCEGDPTVESDAIRGAGEYLVDRGGLEDLDRAIFGYNNSNRYVAAVRAYATVMSGNEQAYYAYHSWQVLFTSSAGLALLPEGYDEPESVDAAGWLAANPEHHFELAVPGGG